MPGSAFGASSTLDGLSEESPLFSRGLNEISAGVLTFDGVRYGTTGWIRGSKADEVLVEASVWRHSGQWERIHECGVGISSTWVEAVPSQPSILLSGGLEVGESSETVLLLAVIGEFASGRMAELFDDDRLLRQLVPTDESQRIFCIPVLTRPGSTSRLSVR